MHPVPHRLLQTSLFSVFSLCLLVALAFSASPCVYISVLFVRTDEAVLAKAVCFHYFQLRLEILIHGRALGEPKKKKCSNHKKLDYSVKLEYDII